MTNSCDQLIRKEPPSERQFKEAVRRLYCERGFFITYAASLASTPLGTHWFPENLHWIPWTLLFVACCLATAAGGFFDKEEPMFRNDVLYWRKALRPGKEG